ncbi:MAG: FISUMP domain-containing protein [Bacteroidota bacterium]
MKKITTLLFLFIISIASLISQVAINTDGSTADNSAILDIKSFNKGVLIPRMTNAMIEAIPSPANGLLVYSTDDNCTYCFHAADNEWKELSIGSSAITPYAIYTIGTGGSCSNTAISGPYSEGVTLITPNTATIDANFTETGIWSVTTNTINGYSYSGSDTVTTTGVHQLTLTGSGTPSTAQTDNFIATANNGGGTCTFDVVVDPAPTYPSGTVHCITGGSEIQNVFNPTTGDIWMDRNLGASQVATSVDDSDAFGDFYQWGRLSDGHQCRSSSTTTTLSNTNVPGHSNFIISDYTGNYDWLSPQNTNLWQGLNGINNPCPTGYRIPTDTEWDNERSSWTENNYVGAYGSPLKLTAGGRRYYSGVIENVNSSGYLWSKSIWRNESYRLSYTWTDGANIQHNSRAFGHSIRCIKEYYAVYEIGSGSSCDNTSTDGIYQEGINMIATNTVTIDAIFTTIGQWYITTTNNNGYTFSGSGTVSNIGLNQIVLTGSGTPLTAQTDSFIVTANNNGEGTCTFNITVNPAPTYPSGTVHCITGGAEIQNVHNPTTGEIWMDRNLGASQVATGELDSDAFGDLYQWGRLSDGHQCRTSSTTTTLSSSNTPGHANYILSLSSPNDWRNPQNNDLWQGTNGTNNPCPSGYRLPTEAEWTAEMQSWGAPIAYYAYRSPLKLPRAGARSSSDGTINTSSGHGAYWSSTVVGTESVYLFFRSGAAYTDGSYHRASGYSVRCIKDDIANYSIGTGSSCSNTTISNSFEIGVDLIASNTVIIDANFTSPGYWNITSNSINGYSFSGMGTVSSTGIQQLTLTGSGTPIVAQTDNFTATASNNGGTCIFVITVNPAPTYPSGTVHCITGGTEIQNVYNPTTGEIWMDRNLGASQVATSYNDNDAYGDLYQWGRLSDGHQCRTSGTTTTLSSTDDPGHGYFIISEYAPNSDWRNPQNDNLWQGIYGVNNPCPDGYRIPTHSEWNVEMLSWPGTGAFGAVNSPLKLTVAGGRNNSASVINVGSIGTYWGSTTNGNGSSGLFFMDGNAWMGSTYVRGQGFSVRCIKE